MMNVIKRMDVYSEHGEACGYGYELEKNGGTGGWDFTLYVGKYQLIISYTGES